MNAKVKVICAGSGVVIQLTKAIRDILGVESGDEVMLKIGDNEPIGPYEVGKVPLSTLRLLRLHQEEDVYAFVPREVNVADGSDAMLLVHELESDTPSDDDGDSEPTDEAPLEEEAPSEEERDDTVVPADDADGIPVESTSSPRVSKVDFIADVVREKMPTEFMASDIVTEAAEAGHEINLSYAGEVLRKLAAKGVVSIERGLTVGSPNKYRKVSTP